MARFTSQSLMVTAQSGQEAALPRRRRDPLPSEMGRVRGSVSSEPGWGAWKRCRNFHVLVLES